MALIVLFKNNETNKSFNALEGVSDGDNLLIPFDIANCDK